MKKKLTKFINELREMVQRIENIPPLEMKDFYLNLEGVLTDILYEVGKIKFNEYPTIMIEKGIDRYKNVSCTSISYNEKDDEININYKPINGKDHTNTTWFYDLHYTGKKVIARSVLNYLKNRY